MYPHKVNESKSSLTVNFSDKGIFYLEGRPFKIFSSKSSNPKAPQMAILDLTTNKRISGLFKIGVNLYQGDIKCNSNKKTYFVIQQLDKNTLILKGFEESLIQGGLIGLEEQNEEPTEAYSLLDTLSDGLVKEDT